MMRKEHLTQDSPVGSARWQSILWIAVIALIYFWVARFSLSFIFEPEGIAAIWPPAGIFLSAILLTRRSVQPYLIAALFFTDLVAEVLAGTPLVVSLVYAAALTGDAVLGAWLLRRFVGEQLTFRQVRQVIGFLLLCILLSNALMSAVAALAAAIYLGVPFGSSWLWWWSSDGVGSLLVTPLIMSLAFAIKTRFAKFKKSQFIEGAVLFLLTAFLNNYAFSHFLDESWFILLLNLFIFPFLIWASFRFGVIGAATISAILAVIILQSAIAGSFARFGVNSNLEAIILVQVYLAMASIPSILLAALITQRKQTEAELRAVQERFKAIASNTPDHILMQDRELRYSFVVNPQLGLTEKDMVGKTDYDFLSKAEADKLTQVKRQVLETGKPTHLETFLISRSGAAEFFDGTYVPKYAAQGQVDGLIGYFRNVTERKRAEEALRHNRDLLLALSRAAQSVQRAHTPDQVYRAVGEEIKSLGYELMIFTLSDDREHLMIAHTTIAANLLRAGEKLTRLPTQTYRLPIPPESIFGRIVAGEGAAFLHSTGDAAAQVLPKALRPLAGQLVSLVKVERGIAAPLRVDSATLGVLTVTGSALNEGDVPAVETFAAQVAISLQNARLAQQAQAELAERKRAEEALRESEAQLEEAQTLGRIGNWEFDLANQSIKWSDETYRLYERDPAMGPPSAEEEAGYYSPEQAKRLREYSRSAIEQGQAFEYDLEAQLPSGRIADFAATMHPVQDATGRIVKLFGTVQDITDRKRADEALHESEGLLRGLFENMSCGAAIYNVINDGSKGSDYIIKDFNATSLRIEGKRKDEVIGKSLFDLRPNIDQFGLIPIFQKVWRTGEAGYFPSTVYIDEKYSNWYENRVFKLPTDEIVAIYDDVTERKRAEEKRERLFLEVQHAREQLQTLSRRLVEVQETERRHIARELHDEVGQVLTGLNILLETTSHLPADTLRSRLSNAQSLVEHLLEQVQGMSLDLRPTMLDDLGLLPALLWFTKRFADQTGVRVHLEHAGLDRRFAPEIETAAYRITQEALTNVARHAGAKEATARLWATLDTLHVQVEDRGQGFDVQAALAVPTSSGLSGMRERAVALGGNLMIESTPGIGTYVTLQVPLSGSLESGTKEK